MICESQGATAQGHKTEFNEGGVLTSLAGCEAVERTRGASVRSRSAERGPRRPLEAVL